MQPLGMHLRDAGCSSHTLSLSALCNFMLVILVCATRWLSMHLYTLVYMSMHESCLLVCRPYFNTMKLWSKPKFVPRGHYLLFAFLLVCLLVCLLAFLFIMLIYFMPLSYALCIFSFHCLSTGFLSLPLHVHIWSKDAWS